METSRPVREKRLSQHKIADLDSFEGGLAEHLKKIQNRKTRIYVKNKSAEEQRECRRQANRTRHRKVIGGEVARWDALKAACGDTDLLFARRLLNCYEESLHKTCSQQSSKSLTCYNCGVLLVDNDKMLTENSTVTSQSTHEPVGIKEEAPDFDETDFKPDVTEMVTEDYKESINGEQEQTLSDDDNNSMQNYDDDDDSIDDNIYDSIDDDLDEMLNVLETYDKVEVDVVNSCRVTSSGRPVRRAAAVASKRQSLLMALETDDTTATTAKVTDTQKTAGDKEKPKGKKIPADPEKEWEKLEFDDYQTDGSDESMSSTEDQACVDDLHMSKELLSNSNMDGTITECLWCDFTCEIDSEMQQHRLKEHNLLADGEFQCDICHEVFSSWRKFRSHKEKEHETKFEDSIICDLCGILVKREFMNNHMKLKHVEGENVCEFCGKVYSKKSQNSYKIHVKSHTEPIRCEVAGCKTKLTHRSLKKHMKEVHDGEKTHVCTACGKGFFSAYNLKVHMRQHSGDHPFRCNFCDYKAKQKICLKLHMKSNHPGEGEHLL